MKSLKIAEVGLGVIGVLLIALAGWLIWLAASHDIQEWRKQASKRYTVQTATAVYEDLQRVRSETHWAVYKTSTGEAIVFNGDFTEIEQSAEAR